MNLIFCGLAYLGAGLAWVAAYAAIRECQITRQRLHKFRRGVIKDCYEAMDEVMSEALARDAEKIHTPSNN